MDRLAALEASRACASTAAPLRDAHLARSRGARGAPAHGHRHRERAARENIELPAGPHRIDGARVHAAHRHASADRGGFPQPRDRRGPDGYLVRLGEVADVQLAAENDRSGTRYQRRPGDRSAIVQLVEGQRARGRAAVKEEIAAASSETCRRTSGSKSTSTTVFIRRRCTRC